MTIATKAKAVYDTLIAIEQHPDIIASPELQTVVAEHHAALNALRRAFMPWDTFVSTTGVTPQAVPGSGGKDDDNHGGQ